MAETAERTSSSTWTEGDPSALPAPPRSFYFGPPDRPLFGSLRAPPRAWSGTKVLLCAPLGYEGLFAHLTLSDLATHLAETCGALVMTFDYDGAGDSAGTDDEAGRVERVLAGIGHAIDRLASIGDSGPQLVVGLRAGALLAAHVTASRDDVAGVALWAPCVAGRTFLREQRAFSMLTTANRAAPDGEGARWGERGFEANGFVFAADAVGALEALNLKTLARPPAPNVLLMHREELKSAFKVPASWSPATVEEVDAPGYAGMMEPPWLWNGPAQAYRTIAEWVRRVGGAPRALAHVEAPEREVAVVAPGVEERPVWFGPGARRFGVLTRPTGGASHATLLVTSTYGYRIGPNRLNVALARRLAESGVATLRIDIGGVGDSRDVRGAPPPTPYDLAAVDDVNAAVAYLRGAGYARVSLSGVCAGAYLAWQGALREEGRTDLVLANIETFDPIPYDRALHASFQAKKPSFREQLDAAKTLGARARIVAGKAQRYATIAGEVVRASLPTRLRRDGLAAQLRRLGRRGATLALIFSDGDPGLKRYYVSTSVHHLRLARRGTVSIDMVAGADHSFTPRWAVDTLVDRIVRELAPR